MYLVESIQQFESFLRAFESEDSFCVPILLDSRKHPIENEPSLLYFKLLDSRISYMLPINHSEVLVSNYPLEDNSKTIYTPDKKVLLQVVNFNNVIDVGILNHFINNNSLDFMAMNTTSHNFFYARKYPNDNRLVPIVKHFEKCEKIFDSIIETILQTKNLVEDKSFIFFNELVLDTLSNIESSGINTVDGMKYSQYNIYTSTGRPSNRFGGVNYAAMSKEDGSRKKIVSRFKDGKMLMFDYDAYHLRLIAKLINYNFPKDVSVHEYLGKQYFGKDKLTEEEYGKSKEVSFRLLYGGIDTEFEKIPFFKAVKKHIFSLWRKYKRDGHIESVIAGKKLHFNNVEGINPQKIFNYMIQLYETEQNMIVSEKVFEFLSRLRTRFVMYTYDSFLFDVYSPEMPLVLKKIKEILESDGDFPVRVYTGSSYDDIKLINT